jgi:putative phosphoribosyl transferase
MIFRDRHAAAVTLIPLLEKYKKEEGVVLAIPRGGVPIGYYIATTFNFPLELIMTKKIGHPLSDEFAIGSVTLESEIVDEVYNIPRSYVDKEIEKIRQSLKEKYKKFMGDQAPMEIKNKTVIITDDGIATGHTIYEAVKLIRQKQPEKIIVAVPVAPREAAEKIKHITDDFICPNIADNFYGVGQFYLEFNQVSDEEVTALVRSANKLNAAA